MDRPRLSKIEASNSNELTTKYVIALERYAKWAEGKMRELEKSQEDDYLKDVMYRLERTEKALDRACEELMENEELITLDNTCHTIEAWKMWAYTESNEENENGKR